MLLPQQLLLHLLLPLLMRALSPLILAKSKSPALREVLQMSFCLGRALHFQLVGKLEAPTKTAIKSKSQVAQLYWNWHFPAIWAPSIILKMGTVSSIEIADLINLNKRKKWKFYNNKQCIYNQWNFMKYFNFKWNFSNFRKPWKCCYIDTIY